MQLARLINIPINTTFTYYFFLSGWPNGNTFNSATNVPILLSEITAGGGAGITGISFSSSSVQISKNGGSFNNSTNVVSEIGHGWYSITFTSTEMNTQDILVCITSTTADPSGNQNYFHNVWLCTTSVGLSPSTPLSELSSVPTVSDTLGNKIQAIFQYLFNKRTVTSTQEKLYKSDNSTVLGTGTLSDDGTTFTKGTPS